MDKENQEKAKRFVKKGVTHHTEQDNKVWEIISDVPYTTGIVPYVLFLMNFMIPGLGTLISACFCYEDGAWSKTQIFVGCLQMMTAVFIVGWIWSIYWGIKFIQKSRESDDEHEPLNDGISAKSDAATSAKTYSVK